MTAAVLTLVAAAILLGGGSNLAQDGDGSSVRCAGIAMMVAGLLALAAAFRVAVP